MGFAWIPYRGPPFSPSSITPFFFGSQDHLCRWKIVVPPIPVYELHDLIGLPRVDDFGPLEGPGLAVKTMPVGGLLKGDDILIKGSIPRGPPFYD